LTTKITTGNRGCSRRSVSVVRAHAGDCNTKRQMTSGYIVHSNTKITKKTKPEENTTTALSATSYSPMCLI